MRKRILALVSAITVFVTMLTPAVFTYAEPGDAPELASATTITVGASGDYRTISEAVAAAAEINPQSEEYRVTINVDPGNYEEQVKLQSMKYITLQQTPGTEGTVNLYWYYCTSYCAGNTGLDGNYDPKVNWSDPRTWTGYNPGDEQFTAYRLGQVLTGVETISYYDTDGVAHRDVPVQKAHLGDFNDQAALVIDRNCSDITVKNFNIVNAIPVMVTEGEKTFGVAPQEDRNADNATKDVLPRRDNLAICSEDTIPQGTDRVVKALAIENEVEKVKALEALTDLTPEESAYLVRSDKYNERGHAIAIDGDRIILEGIRARGNQDSVWVGRGRQYFKDCNLIGGTDYIYGDATVVFDNCLLGAEGMTNRDYGATITAANHDPNNPYGYLFYNCTVYNLLDNITDSLYGRPWRQDAQITFYNTEIDDTAEIGASAAGIGALGWRDMSDNMANLARFYEYGTHNSSGEPADLSGRVVNESVENGGAGMGSVLDEWQILEFNPVNYFNSDFWLSQGKSEWDPMNLTDTYAGVNGVLESTTIDTSDGTTNVVALPSAPSGYEFKWESNSEYATVSDDGTQLTLIRPANGEQAIDASVALYVRESANKEIGNKKSIDFKIEPSQDTENVFTAQGTVSVVGAAPERDADININIYKGAALIKQTTATIRAGETEARYTADMIPVGDYDVVFDSPDSYFTIASPEEGRTTVSGGKGETRTIDAQVVRLRDVTYDIAAAPTTFGSGASVTDNGDGSFTVTGNGSGGAYWKVSDLIPDISDTDAVTIEFTLDMSEDYRGSNNGAAVEITNGQMAGFSTSAYDERYAKINAGRWDQLNMFDAGAGATSGSSNNENQWLNGTGSNFSDTPVQNVRVTLDFKNSKIIGAMKGDSASEWNTYDAFDEFAQTPDKNNIYISVFPGNDGDNMFTIKDISITYKEIIRESGGDTPTPTPTPVTPPSGEAVISEAYAENGNTYVTLENMESGVVIGAKYNAGGALEDMKTADVTGDQVVLEGIEADKVFVWDSLSSMEPLCEAFDVTGETPSDPTTPPSAPPSGDEIYVDFTAMQSVPVYSTSAGQGFVEKSGAIRAEGWERQVASPDRIALSADGASVTETDAAYLHYTAKNAATNGFDSDDYNYGGMIYRIDTGAPGAYRLEVEVTGSSADTRVAPTGMDAGRLTGTSTWDNAGNVPRTVSAKWNGSVWTYDFATGEDFIEIEIEPSSLPSSSDPKTVGVKSIRVTPLANNQAGDKPTIHILGDSTQKTYTFNETISSWGQTLVNYFDPEKVNVVNYSMGGRAMKSNYNEGRFGEILVSGKEGDYVFIHSAHNDETISLDRFSRGSSVEKDNLSKNNASYNRWLDMYVTAIKARGMTPVLVTAMPRTGSGNYSENSNKPNGFNPDSPANMRAKAASDPEVGLIELYEGAKDYIDSFSNKREILYIYNSVEAGETPAENAANGANSDGTHYREAAAKQWCRIMLQSIYDQSVASNDTYTDKDIMQELVSYMPDSVVEAASTGDWSKVFPEMASDVSAVGVVPGASQQSESSFYYRNNIEKALQLGLLHKNDNNLFMPNETVTVGEFARGAEKAFGLDENTLTNYTKTYAELQSEGAAALQSSDEAAAQTASLTGGAEPASGDITVTVQQPEGGSVMVYNETQRTAYTANITKGITANQVISDNEYFTLTAPSEVVEKSRDDAVFPDNPAITKDGIEFRNSNPEKIVKYDAKASGTITVYCYFQDHKNIQLADSNGNVLQSKYMNDEPAAGNGSWLTGVVHFNVEAGNSYQLWARGGTGQIYGVMYEGEYPQSDTRLMVNSGDTVRIVASADSGYLFNSIVVGGYNASSAREYSIIVTSDTVVSAVFYKEPEVIDAYIPSDAALTREAMGAILYDAYLAAYGKNEDGSWNKVEYMNQNGAVPSPDDPNYDPNIQYEGSPYIPLVGWGALSDTDELNSSLYAKVKEAYNLGLVRSEQGIARGSIALGNELEPKAEVTRAKAAKSLVFAFTLTQEPKGESQTLPDGNHAADTAEIVLPNDNAPTVPMQ